MPLGSGDKLGPYEIVAPIGAGGMGEVYRARDPRLARDVAIKTLGIRDPEWRRRFETECRTVSALNHPNILAIYDVGEQDGCPYMVSELVNGRPLTVAENPRKLLDAAVQIADGLAAAHDAGIIHRDLKPPNILITSDGRVKILDFGLAKAFTPEADETVTSPGTIMGTVAYMSPEQARGASLDARSDQFSFGLVLYEMATGKKAFHGESAVETLAAIVKEEAEPIARLNPKLPPPVRWIIERCMAKNPAERYASTSDLFQELRTVRDKLSEVMTPAVAPSVPAANRKWTWWPVALLAGVLIGWAGTWWWSAREPANVISPR